MANFYYLFINFYFSCFYFHFLTNQSRFLNPYNLIKKEIPLHGGEKSLSEKIKNYLAISSSGVVATAPPLKASLIFDSISSIKSGLSLNKAFTESRPCPNLVSP